MRNKIYKIMLYDMLTLGVFFQILAFITKFASNIIAFNVFKEDKFRISKKNSHYYVRMVFVCA